MTKLLECALAPSWTRLLQNSPSIFNAKESGSPSTTIDIQTTSSSYTGILSPLTADWRSSLTISLDLDGLTGRIDCRRVAFLTKICGVIKAE